MDLAPIKSAMGRIGIEDTSDASVLAFIKGYTNIDVRPSERVITERVSQAVNCGARSVIADGLRYIIEDRVVTTVVPRTSVRTIKMMRRGERRAGNWRERALQEIEA